MKQSPEEAENQYRTIPILSVVCVSAVCWRSSETHPSPVKVYSGRGKELGVLFLHH